MMALFQTRKVDHSQVYATDSISQERAVCNAANADAAQNLTETIRALLTRRGEAPDEVYQLNAPST